MEPGAPPIGFLFAFLGRQGLSELTAFMEEVDSSDGAFFFLPFVDLPLNLAVATAAAGPSEPLRNRWLCCGVRSDQECEFKGAVMFGNMLSSLRKSALLP